MIVSRLREAVNLQSAKSDLLSCNKVEQTTRSGVKYAQPFCSVTLSFQQRLVDRVIYFVYWRCTLWCAWYCLLETLYMMGVYLAGST
jgi:hypothetical protein